MNILGEIWQEWVTPEQLAKAGKRVGIAENGLNVNWMDQGKFQAAEAILHPPHTTPQKLNTSAVFDSPEGVRKGSAEYYRIKLNQSLEHIAQMETTTPELEEVPGLMPYKRIVPTKSKNKGLTKMHGTLKATDARKLAEEKQKAEEEALRMKEVKKLKKEEMKEVFHKCKLKCGCMENVCKAIHLRQCPVCFDVMKSQCSKKGCKGDEGELPKMIDATAKKKNKQKRTIQLKTI